MSAKFPTAKLTDIAELNPTLGKKLPAEELVSFVPMASLSAESASVETTQDRPYAEVAKGFTPFLDGDVLVAKITPCFENGKIAQARLQRSHGFGSTEFHVVRARPGIAESRYLHHYLRLEEVRANGQRRMTGSGGQRRVPASFLADLAIPLPPLEEQRRIAAILDQAETLRTQRRTALALLDSLTQSLFLDMFGDPVANPKGLPICELQRLCTRITDGTHQSPAWQKSGIPFLFISNIVEGQINFDTHKFISADTHAELTKRCPIEIGDVLYTTVGSYGNAAVVSTKELFAFQRHIAHIKPDRSKLDSRFLAAMIQSPGVRQQVDKVAKGIAQKTVNLADLKELSVFAPPLPLQQTFATRIASIEALKATHRRALAALDALFAALQQRAFAGAL